jgi:hypothetical protein
MTDLQYNPINELNYCIGINNIYNNLSVEKLKDLELKVYKVTNKFTLLSDIIIKYKLIRIPLNSESDIPLIVMVGLSKTSVCNNLSIIIKNINKINNKYKEIILFSLDFNSKPESYDKDILNEYKIKYKEINIEPKSDYEIYDELKKTMAIHYCKIIKKICQNDYYNIIDIIGVSFGGSIAIFISSSNELNIRQLILMAPGVSNLNNITNKNQNIILGWCIDDIKVPYLENGKKCIQELEDKKYSNYKIILNKLNQSRLEILDANKHIKNIFELLTHSLQDDIFDIL